MTKRGQEFDGELSWAETQFHPKLVPTKLPDINDGWDAKVMAFALGVISGICLCVVIRYIEAIVHLVSNF